MEKDKSNSILEKSKSDIFNEFLFPLKNNKELENRRYTEEKRERKDGEFQRDYTRILYSSSFRRLQGKMQLFAVQSDQFIRNRLTHSLEVAQIARSIATQIGYSPSETYIVEACALAHDIGNPPFGHAGERHLNILSKEFGGFEGNAQTLRILTTVEQKRADFPGLNLTYRTLLGVLKYYNKFDSTLSEEASSKQKFVYDRDYEFIAEIVKKTGVDLRTLDVQIVDLADEIAYAAHDVEDALRLRVFTTEELLHDFCKLVSCSKSADKLDEILRESKKQVGFRNKVITSAEFAKLYRKEITSRIINVLINDIGIVDLSEEDMKKRGTKRRREIGFTNYKELAYGLKKTTYLCITNNDEVYAYENKGEEMLTYLFNFYSDKVKYLPPEYRADNLIDQYTKLYGYLNKEQKKEEKDKFQKRLIIDYLSGMMDEYVKTSYRRLKN